MKKTFRILTSFVVLSCSLFSYSQAMYAQCGLRGLFRRQCSTQTCYYQNRTDYCSIYGYGACTTATAIPTPKPCEPCSSTSCSIDVYEGKKQAETITEELDKYLPSCEQTAPKPCEAVTESINETTTCANGSCSIRKPIANVINAVVDTAVESVQMTKINATRMRYGRSPLALDSYLQSGAKQQSNWMAYYSRLQHGRGGYGGEIIAMNYDVGIDFAINQWLNSSAHCALLLNQNFTRAGVATQRDRYGRNWCTVRFM